MVLWAGDQRMSRQWVNSERRFSHTWRTGWVCSILIRVSLSASFTNGTYISHR